MEDGISAEMLGAEEAIANTEAFLQSEEKMVEEAIKFLLEMMYEHAQLTGDYNDITGALRASLSINIEAMDTYKTKAEALSHLPENRKAKVKVDGDDYIGALYAGMWYAAIVESKKGYSVIQGTIDNFEPLAEQYLAYKMNARSVRQQAAISLKYYNG